MKIINVSLHGDGKKEPVKVCKLSCEKSDKCSLHQKGQCVMYSSFMNGDYCPFGKKEVERGYTNRAMKSREWEATWRKHEKYNALKSATSKVYIVDNELIINTDLISYRVAAGEDFNRYKIIDGYLFKTIWHDDWEYEKKEPQKYKSIKGFRIELNKLTQGILDTIFSLKPRTLFGSDVISSYKDEVLRDLKIVLKQYAPQFIKEDISYIGKKAVLKTCNVGNFKIYDSFWVDWDGTYVITNRRPIGIDKDMIVDENTKYIPSEKFVVYITDNNQVNETTIIL